LDASSKLDFFLVLSLQVRGFIFDFVDLVVQFPDLLLRLPLLFVYSSFDVEILLEFFSNKFVKQLDLGLIFLVLAIALIEDEVFLLDFGLGSRALLLLDKHSHSLHFLQCLLRRFKPFYI